MDLFKDMNFIEKFETLREEELNPVQIKLLIEIEMIDKIGKLGKNNAK